MSFIAELKRRNVFRVAVIYGVVAWLLTQVADTVFPRLGLPDWTVTLVIVLLMLGFPLALLFAWAYELTPEGLKREKEVDREASVSPQAGRRLDRVVFAVLLLALAYFVADKYLLGPPGPELAPEPVAVFAPEEPITAGPGADTPDVPVAPAASAARAGAATIAAPHAHSIAVLPFVNMSDDPGNEFFSDGIADELLNLLARIPELRVISRSSAFSFKGQNLEIPEIARRLNVDHVLEGSVRRAGNRVRITAQLIEASTDSHLWTETYDRTLDDIFAIQDEIARQVVSELRVTLLGEVPTVDETRPEAYTLFLEAQHARNLFSVEGLARAVDLLQQALAIDPGYSPAKIALAVTYLNQAQGGARPYDEAYAEARRLAEDLVAVDPGNARAHDTLAWIARIYDGDLAVAARHAERALALAPGDRATLSNSSQLLLALGRDSEATRLLEHAVLLDPLNPLSRNNLAFVYLATGRLAEAIEMGRQSVRLSPGVLFARFIVGMALLLEGNEVEALAEFEQEPSPEYRGLGRIAAYATLGLEDAAGDALVELVAAQPRYEAVYRASYYAWLGRPDEAFRALEPLSESGATISNVHRTLALRRLHAEPRWQEFMASIGQSAEHLDAIRLEVQLPR